jgi:hypothetical protein
MLGPYEAIYIYIMFVAGHYIWFNAQGSLFCINRYYQHGGHGSEQ